MSRSAVSAVGSRAGDWRIVSVLLPVGVKTHMGDIKV